MDETDPLVSGEPQEPDELDIIAATRVVSVVEWPLLDGSGQWGCKVDYDESMSPFEAHGVLQAGVEHLEDLRAPIQKWKYDEDEGEED